MRRRFWKCDDNMLCIKEEYICDGTEECYDASDEKGIKKLWDILLKMCFRNTSGSVCL